VYDWWSCPMSIMSSVYDLSMGMPTSELIYMIFCRCLVVHRFLIRYAPGSRHTHTTYKVYRLSLVPTSYFGGNSVTHDDVLMMVYSRSSLELSPEKSYLHLFPEITFFRTVRRLLVYLPARMHDSRRLP
jgi:hypothetical protein